MDYALVHAVRHALNPNQQVITFYNINCQYSCQVRVYSGRGSGQVQTKANEGRRAGGWTRSPAGAGDRLDSTTKDNER